MQLKQACKYSMCSCVVQKSILIEEQDKDILWWESKVRKDKEQINIGNSGNIDANCKLIKIKEKFHEDAVDDLVIKESDIFDFWVLLIFCIKSACGGFA